MNPRDEDEMLHPHPLFYAYNLQKRIASHESHLAKLHAELTDIIKFCMDEDIHRQDGYELGYDEDMCLVITKVKRGVQ